jgi:hypothetical protein
MARYPDVARTLNVDSRALYGLAFGVQDALLINRD